MTHEQFIIWLHGFFEISGAKTLTEKQVQVVKDHLNLFFDKHTPDRECECQQELNEVFERVKESIKQDEPEPQENISIFRQCECGNISTNWCPIHGWKLVAPQIPVDNPWSPPTIIC